MANNPEIRTTDEVKQGLTWISDRTDQFRYADKNGKEQWIQQLPRYKVGSTAIKRGMPVCLKSDGTLDVCNAKDYDNCLGIALENVAADAKGTDDQAKTIHVQNSGNFVFEYQDGEQAAGDTPKYEVGQKVYVRGVTNKDRSKSSGYITTNKHEIEVMNHNLICLGTIVDKKFKNANNTNNSNIESVTVALNLTQTNRGPIDETQLYSGIGENFTVTENVPRVFAIGQANNLKFECSLNGDLAQFGNNSFIIVLSPTKSLVIKGAISTSLISTNAEVQNACQIITFNGTNNKTEILGTKTIATIVTKLNGCFGSNTFSNTGTTITARNIGYYAIYLSDDLRNNGLSVSYRSHGTNEKNGAIVADINDTSRYNILGVYVPNITESVTTSGETKRFIRQGVLSYTSLHNYYTKKADGTDETYCPLYLGHGGFLTKTPLTRYGQITQIGTYLGKGEDGEYKILIDAKNPSSFHNTPFPAGYIKKCPKVGITYTPDANYKIMDGTSKYAISDFPALYNVLSDQFSLELTADKKSFIIPKVVDNNGAYMEVKYLSDGIYSDLPQVAFKRVKGTFAARSSGVAKASISAVDITTLINYGDINELDTYPTLDQLDIHLYTKVAEGDWVEIKDGFWTYNTNQVYGYRWKINRVSASDATTYGQWNLSTDIGEGMGIAWNNGKNQNPIQLYGKEWMVYVTRKETVTRAIDMTGLEESLQHKHTNSKTYIETVSSTDPNIAGKVKVEYNLENQSVAFKKGDGTAASISAGNVGSSSQAKLKRVYAERMINAYGSKIISNSDSLLNADKGGGFGSTNNISTLATSYTFNFNAGGLGQALQAIYELPLAYWQYKSDPIDYNKTLGIIIERLQAVTSATSGLSSTDTRTIALLPTTGAVTTAQNTFQYNSTEIASIKEYLNNILSSDNKAQNITSSVGLLLKAAQESQIRLLQLETSVYGADAPTVPNVNSASKGIDTTKLPNGVNQGATALGTNRLIRALCQEVYGTYNPAASANTNTGTRATAPFAAKTTTYSRVDKLEGMLKGVTNTSAADGSWLSDFGLSALSSTYPYTMTRATGASTLNISTLEKFGSTTISNNSNVFNGVNDAVNRITLKLNEVTKAINGIDNINQQRETSLTVSFDFTAPTSF